MARLIVVESPKKAKNIAQYLPEDIVLASGGHVRALPTKTNAVRPEESFALTWELLGKAEKNLNAIQAAVRKVDTLILATDLDREGEAIAWHILEYLKEKDALSECIQVQRVVFNAVTRDQVLNALKSPKTVNQDLVDAQIARSALDLLAGLGLSSTLWRKVPGSRSAGRVQSAALRIVTEREEEIMRFNTQEYWSIHGTFSCATPTYILNAQLTHFKREKLEKFSITQKDHAEDWAKTVKCLEYQVQEIQKKQVQRSPAAPFITSSLQQDASRILGYSPAKTMQLAQKLYEGVKIHGEIVGLITYMRTDSLHLVPEFIDEARSYILKNWGKDYVVSKTRQYKAKKHSQEAHEAIRPTNLKWIPEDIQSFFIENFDEWKLYKLIWDRTLASQMENAIYQQTRITLEDDAQTATFKATGSIIQFLGFLAAYKDVQEEEEEHSLIPSGIAEGQRLQIDATACNQHFTQPPARFTEASLVKELEDVGIGRPSTYARILQVLQERGYVRKEKKRLIPEDLGMIVSAFLKKFFAQYVDYGFTSDLEDQLDDVSAGKLSWKAVLESFWQPFTHALEEVKTVSIPDVLEVVEKEILDLYLTNQECPRCTEGRLGLKLSRTGPFVGCSRYPDCTYLSSLRQGQAPQESELGVHPVSGNLVEKKQGPYGGYVMCDGKRVSSDMFCEFSSLDLEKALWLLGLPKVLGEHPEDGEISLSIGKFGPYLRYQDKFFSVKLQGEGLMALSLEDAVQRIEVQSKKKLSTRKRVSTKASIKTPAKTPKKTSSTPKKTSPRAKKTVTTQQVP
jgi:DNA topoisomerase-1